MSPEALSGEPAPPPAASSAVSAARVELPRLPGTPELTAEGDYRFAGGGLEVVLSKQLGFQIQRLALDGRSCLVDFEEVSALPAAGSAEPSLATIALSHETEVEGSTLVVRVKSTDDSFRLTRRYRIDTARRALEITYGIENAGKAPLSLTTREFWRVPRSDGFFFLPIVKGVAEPKATLKLNVWQSLLWLGPEATRGKPASGVVYASEPWAANVSRGLLLVRTFGDMPRAEPGFPIGVELLAGAERGGPPAPAAEQMKLSVESARLALKPGEKLSFTTRWLVRQLPSSIAVKAGNPELLGFVRGVIQ